MGIHHWFSEGRFCLVRKNHGFFCRWLNLRGSKSSSRNEFQGITLVPWCCDKPTLSVDGSFEIRRFNSPVEGKVVEIPLLIGFPYMSGGWE